MDSVRVDRWVWAVRVYKTRTAATDACRGGHVKINGSSVKPAAVVRVGDTVSAYAHECERVLEVVSLIEKRVGASLAAECFVDHSPPVPSRDDEIAAIFAARDSGSGRPTKRDRREIDRVRRGR